MGDLPSGLPIATLNVGEIKRLNESSDLDESMMERALTVGTMAPELRPYYA